jgi:pimeloyl-ACP methyl ester carboxylesterase
MIHKTISGKQGAIHYWINQNGEQTIVFTHGATMDHGMFQFQWDYFSRHFRVITWDAPLHGRSRPYAHFSLQNAAHELMAILDAEQIRQAHLVGQSMGGYISQIAAAEHPDRVCTLAAVDSSPIQLAYYSMIDRWLLSLTPRLISLYPYATLINMIARQIAISASARAYAVKTLKTFTKAEIAHLMGEVYRGLLQCDHANLRCPILIVYGDRDRTGKVRSYCDRWAAQEKRALKNISRAAHNANMDNPDEFNRVLEAFLAGTTGKSEL